MGIFTHKELGASSNDTTPSYSQSQQLSSQNQIKQNAFLQLFGDGQANRQSTPEKIRDPTFNQPLGNFVSLVVNNIVTKIQSHGYWEKEAQQLFAKRLDTETFVRIACVSVE